MAAMSQNLSAYAQGLPSEAKIRYLEKISMIGDVDPFVGPPGECVNVIPPVEASDLVSYLVLQTSFVTAKQFKAHKSMEAYNQFVCGWVKEVKVWKRKVSMYRPWGRVKQPHPIQLEERGRQLSASCCLCLVSSFNFSSSTLALIT